MMAVYDQVKTPSLVSLQKEDLGELVGCAALGYTMDFLRYKMINVYNPESVDQSYSCPLPLTSFLQSLYRGSCWTQHTHDSLSQEFEGYVVNFTHFVKVRSAMTESMCLESIVRHCATLVRDFCPAIDFVIEAYKKGTNGELSICHVRVSVKNYSGPVSDLQRDTFLSVIHPTDTEPVSWPIATLSCAVAVLINVGCGEMNPCVRIANRPGSKPRSKQKKKKQVTQLALAVQLDHVDCFVDLDPKCLSLLEALVDTVSYSRKGEASEGNGISAAMSAKHLQQTDARFGQVCYPKAFAFASPPHVAWDESKATGDAQFGEVG
jgi:hypothetical protein